MCGIVGYCGTKKVYPILIEGLRSMEERGYDSAGAAITVNNKLRIFKRADGMGTSIQRLDDELTANDLSGTTGIAHTRWKTHGEATVANCHPHVARGGCLAIVHNGMINNYMEMKTFLQEEGYVFQSETDSEVIAHMIEYHLQTMKRKDEDPVEPDLDSALLLAAVRSANKNLEGEYAFLVIDSRVPGTLIASRRGGPILLGFSDHGIFVASSEDALVVNHVTKKALLEDYDVAIVTADGYHAIYSNGNGRVGREVAEVQDTLAEIGKGNYPTFMLKEIFEQPKTVENAMKGRIGPDGIIRIGALDETPGLHHFLQEELTQVFFLAQGTSYYASMLLERFYWPFGIPGRVWYGSEFKYATVPFDPGNLYMPVSQSGETRDVLMAMDRVRNSGCWSFSLCNKAGSHLTTYGPGMYLHAGVEKGVASTKAFVGQVVSGALFGLAIAQLRRRVNTRQVGEFYDGLLQLSSAMETVLKSADDFQRLGAELSGAKSMLYIGQGYNWPIDMEGALKKLEISKIACLGYPAGEMKHGPISLVAPATEHIPGTPVIAICLPHRDFPDLFKDTLNNVQQVISNGAQAVVVVPDDEQYVKRVTESCPKLKQLIRIPSLNHDLLNALLAIIPLQLMAHGSAVARGLDPDKPQNLAKAVTVS